MNLTKTEFTPPDKNENVITFLSKLIPSGVWEHDKQDNNGDRHLKAGIKGPSESIPQMEEN